MVVQKCLRLEIGEYGPVGGSGNCEREWTGVLDCGGGVIMLDKKMKMSNKN